ncbi:MAG: hypothetical protein FJ028_10115, partial [Chloroflexi bacterium]|nr:hypothetical protein [Chloroflexota bacterium]
MTTLRLVDRLPAGERGWYAHYDHVPLAAPGWRRADVRAVLDVRAEAWLDDYDAWHAAVCRRGRAATAWWWLTSASRANVWVHHPLLKPLFVGAALREWIDEHPDAASLTVVGAPAAVAEH